MGTAVGRRRVSSKKAMTSFAAAPPTPLALATSLNQVLADSYALMSLTHLAHWNVEGPGFFALHTAFQTQYEELFLAIDTIAERIRALDAYALGGLGTLATTAGLPEAAAPMAHERAHHASPEDHLDAQELLETVISGHHTQGRLNAAGSRRLPGRRRRAVEGVTQLLQCGADNSRHQWWALEPPADESRGPPVHEMPPNRLARSAIVTSTW